MIPDSNLHEGKFHIRELEDIKTFNVNYKLKTFFVTLYYSISDLNKRLKLYRCSYH